MLATALLLKRLGHPRIAVVYYLVALLFVLAALEEISWGQRLFGWGTPQALSEINKQQETNIHNIAAKWTEEILLIGAAILALAASLARAVLHRQRRVTTADFLLPSLVLSPALLMIIGTLGRRYSPQLYTPEVLQTYLGMPDVVGKASWFVARAPEEVHEILLALCLVLFTFANLRRAWAVRGRLLPVGDTPEKQNQNA